GLFFLAAGGPDRLQPSVVVCRKCRFGDAGLLEECDVLAALLLVWIVADGAAERADMWYRKCAPAADALGIKVDDRPAAARSPIMSDKVERAESQRVGDGDDVCGRVLVAVVLATLRSGVRAVAALIGCEGVVPLCFQPFEQRDPHVRCLREAMEQDDRLAICWAGLAAAEGEAIGSDVADGDWHGCSCGNVGGAGRSLAGERESSEERARDCCWYNCVVTFGITHRRGEETPEAKAVGFSR